MSTKRWSVHFIKRFARISIRKWRGECWIQIGSRPWNRNRRPRNSGKNTFTNVRFWHKADMAIAVSNIRFWGADDRAERCPLSGVKRTWVGHIYDATWSFCSSPQDHKGKETA